VYVLFFMCLCMYVSVYLCLCVFEYESVFMFVCV